MTAVFLLWLFYRLIVQPAWVAHLPGVAGEMLHLAEAAGLVTLGLLWGVVWLRRGGVTAVTVQPLDLERLYDLSPAEFEQYVAGLFRKKGYQVQMRGRSGDLGVDILLTKADGRQAIVQCK
ncbi:MAG TPA: restriction endonuclease, partial [Anaerolineae bacterium]|nr:restriction endonuclease [Anaerolineae bacterium]